MPNNAINNSSNVIVKKALIKISKKQLPNDRIIGPHNYFVDDTITKIRSYSLGSPKKDHLAQYIAASAITHCCDGWNFLSRGVESYLNGDIASSIHFVYYSELRAVMSMMASNGIGIFDKRHIYFDSHEQDFDFRRPTHPAADELMNAFSNSAYHKTFIFKLIKVNNRTLHEWITSTGASTGTAYANSIVKKWLQNWSIDLRLSNDKELRNEVSYRPHFNAKDVEIKEGINKLLSIWTCLEPSLSNRFNELDRFLLRLVIEEIFKLSTGQRTIHGSYIQFIELLLSNIGEAHNETLYNFLIRRDIPDDHLIIQEAKKDSIDKRINLIDPLPMICRSILLLRLSTGAASNLLEECRIDGSLFKFWWENSAYSMGIIHSKPLEINTNDLYVDIRDAKENLLSGIDSINSIYDAMVSFPSELNIIKQFQRACFWGLGL